MNGNLITLVFAVLLGLLLVGSLGAFLLAVPMLSVISVASILISLILMFALGMHAGGRRIRLPRRHV